MLYGTMDGVVHDAGRSSKISRVPSNNSLDAYDFVGRGWYSIGAISSLGGGTGPGTFVFQVGR